MDRLGDLWAHGKGAPLEASTPGLRLGEPPSRAGSLVALHRGAAVARGLPPAGGVDGPANSSTASWAARGHADDRHILESSPGADLHTASGRDDVIITSSPHLDLARGNARGIVDRCLELTCTSARTSSRRTLPAAHVIWHHDVTKIGGCSRGDRAALFPVWGQPCC